MQNRRYSFTITVTFNYRNFSVSDMVVSESSMTFHGVVDAPTSGDAGVVAGAWVREVMHPTDVLIIEMHVSMVMEEGNSAERG